MAKGIGKRYMLESQYKSLDPSEQSLGLPQPPLELDYDHSRPTIELPNPATIHVPSADVRSIIEQRRSVRAYSEQRLTLEELSWLLWATQGVQKVISRPATLRAVPSAGARHAFETYLLVNKVMGITPGLYRYAAGAHKLVEMDTALDMAERVAAAAWGQEFVAESAVTFIWVAVLARMYWRYGERAYRYLFLDAGHVCQNLYLAAEAIGCGVCAMGAFYEDLLHPLLGIDGEEQFAVYLGAAGKKKMS